MVGQTHPTQSLFYNSVEYLMSFVDFSSESEKQNDWVQSGWVYWLSYPHDGMADW